ncbi:metal-dependent hydrolase [Streptomyces scopuliridis]|uniref:Metal-dependent hydrolase n=1 Tax=Streptomyces scopuliridis TaxID=452529 RepID=A0ACD4ZLC2_9ACTN|nr:metal-dependent hydrolase [Streptomyces scopuliridis]WSB34853.1 metal-dependent hydrolase [Streptomyces scopuliridis]WSB99102.1 metal-dependent hydrolase [Streptomyces scopuliridis]WSC07195.1 metal-dependent hydrolase [Streptomyces scopuliridis]
MNAERDERHPIVPRRVSFDWRETPLHWIPDEPTATHVVNVLHLLLPAGERWFVKVFKEGLPLVTDARLLQDVKGFMGQEATHSVQHSYVLNHLAEQRLDTDAYTRHVDFLFERLLGEEPPWGIPFPAGKWLLYRLAFVAAIEQFTAVLGDWVLRAEGLDRAGADEVMLDLLRWHGAEEVEHRAVAFDMYQHCGGSDPARYARRIVTMCVTAPVLLWLWAWGAAYLIRHDPQLAGRSRYSLREHNRAVDKGLLPTWRELGSAIPRYFRRSYHPSQECSLRKAVDYLATSPAARAAAGAVGRAALGRRG